MSEQPDTPASNPLAFSEWSASNVFDDPLESRLRYGNYLREEYINEGVYDAKTEGEIRAGFSKSLVKGGLLNEDGSNQEELEERINTLQRKDVADDTQLQDQVNVGELPMARLSTGQLLVGDAAANTDIVSAIKASSFGGVNMSDALAAQAQLDTPDGFDMPLYKIQRVANATRLLQTERKNNTAFDIQIDGLSTEAAQDEYSTLDWLEHSADAAGRGVVNFFARMLGKGDQVDEEEKRRDALKEAQGADVSQLATQYAMKLDLAPEDTQMALEQMILENGVNKGMFELHDLDDKDVGKNLRMGGYGLPVMSAKAMVNKDLFDATLAAHPELSEEVKTMLNKQRTQVLRSEFTSLDKFLSGSNVSDSWNTALVAGRSAGLADYKILESFVADEDNYNEFKERAAGIGMSFVNGVGQLFAAIPAAMGFEGAKDYLADVAQKNADRRQLAEVFGQEFGLFQDLGETAFPMLVDMGATVLLSVATAPAGGVGGVAYLGAKSAGTVGARLTAKGIVKGLTSRTLMRTTAKGAADQADDLIKDGIIKGSKEGAIDIIKAYNGKVAQRLRNVPAVFIPAATRSGSATYGAVYNQLQQNPDVSADEAHDRALGAALMAGTFTGLITGAFSAIGKGGLEDALLKGLSTKQMNRVAQSITDRFEGDMLSSARKAISKAMKDAGMVSTIKGLKVPVLSEGAEEGIDEFVNSLITDASLDEDTPMIDRIMQGFHAALLGGIMGGSVPLVQRGLRRLRPEAAVMQEKASFFDDILENMTANLNESGSPITAEVITAILTDPTRKDTRVADVPTEEEQQQILGEDEQDVVEEGESLGSGINPDPEMESLLDERVTPDNVQKAVASVLAEDVPTIEGADTTTVEAKSAMMEQLNLPLQETSAAENSDHLAVRGLIGGRRVTREGSQFAKRLQDARPAEENTIIDPARKAEAEQIEATFREEAAKIDEAAALYNKLERQVQGAEDASGASSSVRRGLQQRVSEGKALSPEKATELKGEAFKKRVLALKGLKIKTKVELEEVIESEEETQSIEKIASHGFPHVLNAAKLKKLGVPVNERTVSNTFLNAASDRIESEINNRFPRIKQSKPNGGFAIDSLYGKGKVYMDRFGVGKFDNDPLNMLTLLEMGNPVVVTPDQLNSSTINPAFRFTRLGDQVVVSDIVAPQSGGLVSVLTPATRAVNIQPDYTRLVNLIDRVSALRKEGLTNPDELVPSPFDEEAQISKADLLQRLETSASVAEFFPRARLTNNFAESALIELRLRAQESLFTGKRVELVSLGREVQELYVDEQLARLRGVNESYLSTVEVSQTSALAEDNEFRADTEAQDNYTPFPENAPAPFAESQIKNVLRQTQADAVAAVDGDIAIRNSLINLLRNEAFEGASPNFDKMSGKKLFDFTLQWMAQGNNRSNRSSLEFQRALRDNNFELAAPIREALQIMGLSPVSLEGTPDTNPAYKELLRAKLSEMKGGAVPSDNEISSFYNYVRRSVGTLLLRSQPFSGGIGMLDMLNGNAVEALGLKSGDSSSIVEALERIVGVSGRAQKEYDSHLVAIARLLLRSPDFLNSIELSIVKSKLPFAGTFDVLTDGTPAITINLRGHNPRGVADTLVHELIHAYVTGITRKAPAELTVQEANALKGLENVIGAVKKEFVSRSKAGMSSAILSGPSFKEAEGGYKFYDSRVSDALRNVDEFVAHFLTSTDFQKFVKSVLANSTLETQAINQNQTLFERIITAIRTLFKDSSVKFDAAFSSVLDLSHAAVLTKQGARRKNKDLISLSDFKALSDVSSKGAKDFIADKVFSDTPATNDTSRREPVTADAIVGKISEDVSREQHEAVRLSSGLNETTSKQTELDRIRKKNVSRVVSFIQNFIIPPEMRVELDSNHKGLADVNNKTGVMRINPVRLTKLLHDLKTRNGGNPVSTRTQMNMLAVVLNEEVAHAASVAVITREDQDAIINEMTLAQAEEAVKNYGDEGNESERVRLIEGWKRGERDAQVTVMEEYLRMYSQKVTRGFTTEEEVSFLRQNPSAISVVKRHFKRYVNKLGFYRSRKNISPQLRTAVGRVVNEIRAMESGFRLGSNFRAFDPNDPESVINLFRKQAEMNKPVGSPEEEEERSVPVAASGISADIPADATTVLDGDEWENVGPQLGSNKGGQYVDPATGVKYYYKESQTPDHARNEVLATVLYETAGAKVVPVRLTNREGELGTSSVFREDLKEFDPKNETMRKAAFPDFAVHALLANWDVVGLVYDNLMVDPDGNVVHLDTGGALKFRAQGEPKGDAWNGGGSEFSTLRVMGQAGEVFKGMTEQDLQDSARKLLSLSNETITEVVQQVLGTDNDSQEMINTLIERRDNILTAAFTDKEFYLESKALGSGITEQSTDDQIAKMIPELLPDGVLGPIRMRSSKRAMLRQKAPVARKNLSAEERAELKELGEQYAKIIDDNAEEIIKIQNTLTITPDIADTVQQFQYVEMESEDESVESYLDYVENDSPSKLKKDKAAGIPQFGADRPRSKEGIGFMAPEIPTAIRKQLQPLVDRAAEIAGYNVQASHISRDIVTGKVVRYVHGTSVADEMGVAQYDTFDSTKSEYAGTEQGKKGLTFFGNTKNISLVQRFIDMQEQGYGESYIPIALKDDAKIFDPRVNFNEFKDTIELAMAYREAGFETREHENNPEAEKQVLLRWREDPQYKRTMDRARYGHWQEMEQPDVVEAIMEKYDAMLLTDSVDTDFYRDDNTGKIADEYMNLALQDPNLVKSTAPITFGPDNQIIPLEERFNPNSDKFLESGITFGDSSDLPSDFNGDGVDYSDFVGVLEMPIAEKGGFKNVKNGFMKLFVGETDPTVQRYVRQRDAFVRTSDDMVEEYYSKYKAAVEKDFKDPDEIPWDVIQTATGTTDNIDPDPDNTLLKDRNTKRDAAMVVYQNDLSSEYQRFAQEEEAEKINIRKTEPSNAKRAELLKQAAIDRRKKEEQAKETLGAIKQAAYEKAQDEYKEAKDKAFDIKKAEFIRERNEAFATLKDIAPNLFPVILDLRRLTDELSKSAKNLFGAFSSKDLSVKFDNNMGLYVTRRYQMFSDPDYKERILTSEDERSRAVRDAAIDFMREQYIEFEFQNQKKQGRSDSDAKAFARAEYDRQDSDGVPLGFKMISEFLNSYDTESGTVDFASAFDFAGKPATKQATMGGALKALTKNLEGRAEIPKPLADLMGANNIPEDSLDSLLYTFGTVAKIAAHQNFLVKMRMQGEQNGWLISAKQHAEDVKNANTEKQIVEVGQRRLIQPTGSDSGLNPLAGLYVDKDIYESIKPMFQQTVRQPNDAASKVLQGSLRFMQKATGNAMAAKTLGSVGFYMRNALGNVMFFGPAQGYFGAPKDLFLGSSKRGTGMSAMEGVIRSFKGRKAEANGYLRSLEALGVFGDEVRSEIMMKLMTGEETFNSLDEQLESLAKKSENLVGKPLRAAQQTAARLASAMDSFYKIGYFENELATVKKAAKAEKDNPKLARKFSAMTELQQKEYAADIISATAQSYARALPVIKKLSGSSAGLLIAPFVRFTSEVPRITVNTVRQFSKEIADSNPVIRARGYKRAVGFTSVMAVSTAVPVLLGKFLSGLGEDEDEAYRMSLPPYLRNHTFYYFTEKAGKAYDFAKMISGGKDGDIVTLDLTYLNPFSVVADPILRGMEHALRGEPLQATTKFLYTALFEPYLGDQILAGAVIDIKENRDARTGRPIFEESDPAALKTGKMLTYIGREAYGPRTVLKAIEAYQAAGGKVTKFADSPFGIIMSEFLPVRPRANDPSDQFSRVAFRLRDEQRRVQQRFGELKQSKGMSEGSVRGVYEDVLKSRLRINNRMAQAMRGFQGLGVTNYKIYQGLQSANYGERRSKLLFSGFMENPVPTKNLVDFLMRSPQGQQRLGWLMQAQSENPRFIKLED